MKKFLGVLLYFAAVVFGTPVIMAISFRWWDFVFKVILK